MSFQTNYRILFFFLCFVPVLEHRGVFAQIQPPPSESTHREVLRDSFRVQQELQNAESQDRGVEIASPQPRAVFDDKSDIKQFKLNGVVFEPFPQTVTRDELHAIVSRYTAMEAVSLRDIYMMLADIDAKFDSKGVVGRATLPVQDVENGMVTVNIIEGRVANVKLLGGKRAPYAFCGDQEPVSYMGLFRSEFIRNNFSYKKGEILNTKTLERKLERYNGIYRSKLVAEIEAGTEFGTSDIGLTVMEPQPISVGVYSDSSGRRQTGQYRIGGFVQMNSLLGFDESLMFSYDETEGTEGLYLYGDIPVTNWGTFMELSFDRSDTETLKGPNVSLNPTGNSKRLRPGIRQILFSDNNRRFGAYARVELYESESKLDGLQVYQEDLTTVMLGLDGQSLNEKWSRFWSIGGNFGNGNIGIGNRHEHYSYLTGSFTQAYYASKKTTLILQMSGQWALSNLISSRQYQIGGMATVRGVKEALMSADSGYLIKLEGRHTIYQECNTRIDAFAFFDHGNIFYRNHGDIPGSDQLYTIGGGVTGNLGKYLNITAGVGFPLFRNNAHYYRDELSSPQGYFSVQFRF